MLDLQELFTLDASIVNLLIRGTVVYWSLFVMFRLAGRRNIGAIGFADLVVLMMVASAVGDTLGGGATTLLDGLIVAGAVIGWSALIDRLCYFVPAFSNLIEPPSVCLVEDGKILVRNLREQLITRAELMEQLRLHGITSLPDVKLACLEANGEISVIPKASGG